MNLLTLSLKSFLHFFKGNLLIMLGIALTTCIIAGALIVGDSLQYSLQQTVKYRLGKATHYVSYGDRLFTSGLAKNLSAENVPAAALLKTSAMASSSGGAYRVNNIQFWGVSNEFNDITGAPSWYDSIQHGEIIISQNTAQRLQVNIGDQLLVKIEKLNTYPSNAPFVAADNQTISQRLTIKAIAEKKQMGRLHLENEQNAPYNFFVNIHWMQDLLGINGKANILLLRTNEPLSFIKDKIQQVFTPGDANILIEKNTGLNQWHITSERIFIDNNNFTFIQNALPQAKAQLTYFANAITKGDRKTPYSFISSSNEIEPNQMVVNQWLANDLNAITGDSIWLNYFVIGPMRQLKVDSAMFVVKKIVPISGIYADKQRMPNIPGLSDAGNCRDWNTGIPIDLENIRDKDEVYWDVYRGTPKAFINTETAKKLWHNRFGSYTALSLQATDNSLSDIQKRLQKHIIPAALGLQIIPALQQGQMAAKNGVDFAELFLGLSFFIILSGIFLTVLLFKLHIEMRFQQIGTFSAFGFSRHTIQKIYLTESGIIAIFGSVIGSLLAIPYNRLIFSVLNTNWHEIVRTSVLEVFLKPSTIILGMAIGIGIALGIMFLIIRRALKRPLQQIQNKVEKQVNKRAETIKATAAITMFLCALLIIAYQLVILKDYQHTLYFLAGFLLLIAGMSWFYTYLTRFQTKKNKSVSFKTIVYGNLFTNRNRHIGLAAIMAIGMFLVNTTGANRKDLFSISANKTSGTGGFRFYAESSVPVLFNINDKSLELGLPDSLNFTQLRRLKRDDANCLNLNQVTTPNILGVNPTALQGRFKFISSAKGLDEPAAWHALNINDTGVIPAIADQTVIKWSLLKNVGDTLKYQAENGDTIYLKLMAGLDASVFQGNVLISEQQFLKHFPSSSGTSVFLIDAPVKTDSSVVEGLNMIFRDFGWDMQLAAARLAEFKSVENTYLDIFLILGTFGVMFATIGIAIILARSIWERKAELSVFLAQGFSRKKIWQQLFSEYHTVLLWGLIVGLIAAVIAVFPALVGTANNIKLPFLVLITALVYLNGLIWIVIIGFLGIKAISPIKVLANE